MKQACFDANGRLLWTAEDMPGVSAPSGCKLVQVADEFDPNEAFYDGTKVVTIKQGTVALDKTLALVGEAVQVTIPAGAWLMIEGRLVKPSGTTYTYTPSVKGMARIELAGTHRSAPAIVQVSSAVDAEAKLLDDIDAQREALQMGVMTTGGAKKYVYARKAQEAETARGVLASVLNALSLVDRQKKYPFASAEMEQTGETLSVVLARFDAGVAASASRVAKIEAAAQKAKRAVRAAPSLAAKRTAANIAWPT